MLKTINVVLRAILDVSVTAIFHINSY